MVSNEKELSNRETAGYEAMDRGNWRLAYDCFRDCYEYLKYYESWREDDIEKFKNLYEKCNSMF